MSLSLKPASIASAVYHPYQIIVLYMLTTLLSQGFKLLYEGKNTVCMVNMVIVVSGIFPTKPLMRLSVDFIESCYSRSQHKSSVWQVVQLAQPSINLEVHVPLHHSYIT